MTLAGDTRRGQDVGHLEAGDVKMKMANLAGYYVFNHRRFSYPAAFTQSYIQRRSAGSWLAGISYQGGTIETTDDLKARSPKSPDIQIRIGHIGIGGGYGYNLVLGQKWLLHLSILPTFVVYNYNKLTVNGERREAKQRDYESRVAERYAIERDKKIKGFRLRSRARGRKQ
jgi:hypothetical protein